MSIMQISVFLENKSGALANLTSVLAENKVNLQAMNVAETSEFGIVRIYLRKRDTYVNSHLLLQLQSETHRAVLMILSVFLTLQV